MSWTAKTIKAYTKKRRTTFSALCLHSSVVFRHSPNNISTSHEPSVSLDDRTETETIIPMDSLNFFFGLKAVRTPEVLDTPLSGTAIVYMSKHGTTQKVALLMEELLKEEKVTLVNLEEQEPIDLSGCDRVIIGGSVHMGKIQKEIQAFCMKNLPLLKSKSLGLFLCCMYEGVEAEEQFDFAFPDELRAVAKSKALMGYELYFDRMNFIEKAMTKKITGLQEFTSHIHHEELTRFINELKQ